jgi:ubiquinone/menaquinone biosynthesis C-methylase UbiE
MDAKHVAQERFGKYAASYVASAHHAAGPDLQRLVRLAGHHPSWQALDIATGGGHTALAIAPHVARVIATDLTEPMLEAARRFILSRGVANVEFRLADAEDLPFAAGSFDLVTCRIAAHHFPDPGLFCAEVLRVLRPMGLFLLQDQVTPEDQGAADWITRFEKRRDPSHERALSGAEWLRLLGASGFSVETEDRFEKRLSLVKWVADQEGTPEDLADLRAQLRGAPPAVAAWIRPTAIDTAEAEFSIHHRLFSARKTGLGDMGAGC